MSGCTKATAGACAKATGPVADPPSLSAGAARRRRRRMSHPRAVGAFTWARHLPSRGYRRASRGTQRTTNRPPRAADEGANEFRFHVAGRRARRRLHRRQRDGAPDARPRLGLHAAGTGVGLGQFAQGRAGAAADLALRDVAGLGRGHRLLLQRCLPADPRRQASAVARHADARGVSGDLGRHQGAHARASTATARRPGIARCCC